MHRHTRCMGVGGVNAPSRRVIVPPGALGGLIHQSDSTGDLLKRPHGGDPLPYCPPVPHPLTKVTVKLT